MSRRKTPHTAMMLLLAIGFATALTAAPEQRVRRGVIIETIDGGPAKVVAGDRALVSRSACPASLFKLVITWAGLETGVLRPDTLIPCREDRIASGLYQLGLRDALLRSSNRYFEVVAGRIGTETLTEYARKSGIAEDGVPDTWLRQGVNSAAWGGDLLVTPDRIHHLMTRIAAGTLASSPANESLVSAIEWPGEHGRSGVFGKSGTMRGAAWFTGFSRDAGGSTRVVTVFLRGGLSRKSEAAELFFGRLGMKPPVLPPLGGH